MGGATIGAGGTLSLTLQSWVGQGFKIYRLTCNKKYALHAYSVLAQII